MDRTTYNVTRDAADRASLRLRKHQTGCPNCVWARSNGVQIDPNCTRGRFLEMTYRGLIDKLAYLTRVEAEIERGDAYVDENGDTQPTP